jgi:uncharacterized repeat protein (TIGR03803 family)
VATTPATEAPWAEVEAVLDAVIDELPDALRAPLVMHFLQNRSQREIAREIGVSQSTVSRTLEAGLAELRSRLRARGVLCGAGLAGMLAAQAAATASAASVPAGLMTSLAKLGMSGIGGVPVPAAATASLISTKMKAGIAAVFVAGAGIGTAVLMKTEPPVSGFSKAAAPVAAPAPANQGADLPEGQAGAAAPPTGASLAPARHVTSTGAVPVHELVHSFPTPPAHPSGHLVRDSQGWLWGTTTSGGNYGLGTLYKMRQDGSDWQEMVSFNGTQGVPRGSSPRGGVTLAADGAFWGVTAGGGVHDHGTLYRYEPRTGALATVVDFAGLGSPWGRPFIAPDGQVWGTTYLSIYRFNPVSRELAIVFKTGQRPNQKSVRWIQGELAPDGQGFLWGTAAQGSEEGNRAYLWGTSPQDSRNDNGIVFKINMKTGAFTTVIGFTGKGGPCPGAAPRCGLTLDSEGYFWGTTYRGGGADSGTVFKIHSQSGAFTHVAEFKVRDGVNPGANPETVLCADGEGGMWGTTSYGGRLGKGTVFKLDVASSRLQAVVNFTGIEGAAPGGPARGHLLNDGAGGLIGVCDFGGAGWIGTIYRIDLATGGYTLLKDISDSAKSTEGSQPHGRLTAGADGWLWGVTNLNGAHHCGTVYKLDPVTNALVTVVNFTGTEGPHKGRFVRAGLQSDGEGWLWGTTFNGGAGNRGTVYKVHEATGAFATVVEFGSNEKDGKGVAPRSELVPDGRGFMWGATASAIFKVHIRSHALTTIAKFTGDEGPHFGSNAPGTMALDDQGFLWGCALANRTNKHASVFKIDVATDSFATVAHFPNANQGWDGWHPQGDMHWDGRGAMWFTGVTENGGRNAKCQLVKMNTRTGVIEGRYLQPGRFSGGTYAAFGTPTGDDHGVLWGASLQGRFGGVYTFDTRTNQFAPSVQFTGQGSQTMAGYQPQVTRLVKHTDGNFYAVTRYGGPGNGGTIFRMRFGPTPMTQEAILLADGNVALHGTLTPNGLDSDAAFEWGADPLLKHPASLPAGRVPAGTAPRAVSAILSGLPPETTYYFRLRGTNAANAIPQRGAILSFTTPPLVPAGNAAVAAIGAGAHDTTQDSGGSRAAPATEAAARHVLKVNRIPGAGAGLVHGLLAGPSYQIGRRYSLTAQADNDYIFHHWSGPGIRGPDAANPRLNFVFTEDLARSPVIHATFVRNPFRGDAVGLFTGLVLAAEGVPPDVSNTGALSLMITRTGAFSGTLRYDRDVVPFAGAFDPGGLARFGPKAVSPWTVVRRGKPMLSVAMQIDLGTAPPEVFGVISSAQGMAAAERSTFAAARSYYDGRLHIVPAPYLAGGGYHSLSVIIAADDPVGALLHVTPAGSATLATRLGDGTAVLTQGPLSHVNEAAFFIQLYHGRAGSLGGMINLDSLLPSGASADQAFWWSRADQSWQHLLLRKDSSDSAQ